MQNKILRKGLAVGIILLFVCVSVISGIEIKRELICKDFKVFSHNINDGLAGYWSFDEIKGNVVLDESENNNDGEMWEPIETVGYSGLALNFDGVDDSIYINNDPSLNFHDINKFSLSIWVKREGSLVSGSEGLISKSTGTPKNAGYRLFINVDDTLSLEIRNKDPSGGYDIFSNSKIDLNKWYHLVAIWDGIISKLYINGVLDNSETFNDVIVADDDKGLELGNHYSTHSFHGAIDEVRIYNRVLSNDEIIELYNNPAGLKKTILFGQINNLSTNVGNLEIFEAQKLRYIQFFPFEFKILSSGERIKVSDNFIGMLTTGFAFGLFSTNIYLP